MLYLPFPFKVCTKCDGWYLPTARHFTRHKHTRDRLNSWCRTCNITETRQWRSQNKEQIKSYNQQYALDHSKEIKERTRNNRLANPYKFREQEQRWRKANPDKKRQSRQKWIKANPDKVKAQRQRTYQRNKDKSRSRGQKWQRANTDKVYASTQRYRQTHAEDVKANYHRRLAHKKNLPYNFTGSDWKRCLEYFHYCCAVCGKPQGLWHKLAADHWIPLSDPDCPGTIPENILPLCHGKDGCNNHKSGNDPVEWLTKRYGKRKANQILKAIQAYFDWIVANHEKSPV